MKRLVVFFISLFALLALLIIRKDGSAEFCTVCGAAHQSTDWDMRFSHVRLFSTQHVEATPFSALLVEKHLVGNHSHTWLAPREVPDPLNEFAPPVTESLGFLNTPRIVGFMRNLSDFADPDSLRIWQQALLMPKYSYVLDNALVHVRASDAGYAKREEFIAWWGNNAFPLYNQLREKTEAD